MEQILFSSDHKRKRECCFEPDLAQERDRHPVDSKGNTSTSITFCSKPRNGLTRDLAIEIYKKRPEMMGFKKSRRGTMVSCEAVAIEFGVTPKTIRDIWRGRTWSEATGHPQSDSDCRCALWSIPELLRCIQQPNLIEKSQRQQFSLVCDNRSALPPNDRILRTLFDEQHTKRPCFTPHSSFPLTPTTKQHNPHLFSISNRVLMSTPFSAHHSSSHRIPHPYLISSPYHERNTHQDFWSGRIPSESLLTRTPSTMGPAAPSRAAFPRL